MIRMGNLNLILSTASYGFDLERYNDLDSPNYTNTFGSVTTHKSLKCWYTNADSLSNKFNELKSRLSVDKSDIVAITEVNCKFGGSNAHYNIEGYKTIQHTINTTTAHQRGVCIFIKSELYAYLDDNLSSGSSSESIWCRVPLTNNDCLLFGVVYRSPNSSIEYFNSLCSLLTQAANKDVSHLLITGDFNMPCICSVGFRPQCATTTTTL